MSLSSDVDRLLWTGIAPRGAEPGPADMVTGGTHRALTWLDARPMVALLVAIEVAAFLFIAHVVSVAGSTALDSQLGVDLRTYTDATRAWLAGDGLYWPYQLAGPYPVFDQPSAPSLYPPPALVLFVPFTVLPPALWWAIPLGIVGAMTVYHRPAPWAWPVLALLALNKWTFWLVASGNPVMWCAAAVALGTRWPFAAPFALLKPTVAPFGLVGVRSGAWWAGLAVVAALAIAFAPMWPDYLAATLNARNPSIEYLLANIPLMLLPVIAWAARR